MQPTEDERVLAALSHASIVANIVNMAGMIATTMIWTTQRDQSRFVRAHALQALVYQGAVLLISVTLALLWSVCLALSLLPVMVRPDLYQFSNPPRSFWLALFGLTLPIGFGILATIYGLYGAYRVYRGRPFRYPLVGRLVRQDLMAGSPAPTAEAPTSPAEPTPIAAPAPTDATSPATPSDSELPQAPEAPTPTRRSRRRPPPDEPN